MFAQNLQQTAGLAQGFKFPEGGVGGANAGAAAEAMDFGEAGLGGDDDLYS
jgi:hypothetical protein